MFIPTIDNQTDMTPYEFEQYVMLLLEDTIKDLTNAEVKHNELFKTAEGNYQIDGTIRFDAMGVNYLTIVECKMYKGPISREKVQVLYDKLRATGAQKGILVTTSFFQSGAIDYASSHGIALVQIIDGKLTYEVRCYNPQDITYPDNLPKFVAKAQYRMLNTSIGSCDVIHCNYLFKFIVDEWSVK